MKKILTFLLLLFSFLYSFEEEILTPTPSSLYKSIEKNSIKKLLAFYELFPETTEGKEAIRQVWRLVTNKPFQIGINLPDIDLNFIISLVNGSLKDVKNNIQEKELKLIEKISENLANRKLKGFQYFDEEEILKLPKEEVDIARALFVSHSQEKQVIKLYEAAIDLMALQIKATLDKDASPKDKIKAINKFIFHEMNFRFPPLSLHTKNIDTYTFLPSVIDSRRGVCLGVSILYLCIAQRLDLELEAITPPGHIFVRYRNEDGDVINIETTARGIDIPSENYMGIDTLDLQKRNYKEVIGLAFMNAASCHWQSEKYDEAIKLYQKADKYVPNDMLIQEFLAYNLIFTKKIKEGKKILNKIKYKPCKYSISKNTLVEDFLNNKIDAEGIKTVFMHTDEKRHSIIKKQKKLIANIKKYPKFRAGIFQLASTFLQLGNIKKAKTTLEILNDLDPTDPTVNYYLSVLNFDRYDYRNAWKFFNKTKKITKKYNHKPKALKELEIALKIKSPN